MFEEFVLPKHAGGPVLQECSLNQSAADVLDDLSDHDALYITEDGTYERCEELARSFLKLEPHQRSQAVEVLAANLSTICSSVQHVLSSCEAAPPETVMQHRNGLKMLVYLLHVIALQAERDAEQAKGSENAALKPPKATGRGRKTAAAALDDAGWDWKQSRQRVLVAVHAVMCVDLKALFKGLAAAERMVNLCMELALQVLDSPTVIKQEGAWPACRDVLVRGAVLYEQLDFVAAALMERARKHEHMPPLAASTAKYAEEAYNSTQLAVMLLAEFWNFSPEDYDAQYATNALSVRLAGEVVTHLAELLPKVVSNHFSQLRPYLACSKAHCLRGALLSATGTILVQVFPTEALSSSLGAGAAQAHLRSKETLLALLHSRTLDKAALVRQKVLQTWARLVEESCVPLSHWNSLLSQAIGRLEDESQLVVKAALQLLHKMVHQGIFHPPLKAQVYINTLRQKEQELAALQPSGRKKSTIGEGSSPDQDDDDSDDDEDEDDGQDDDSAQDGNDAADVDGACWEKGGLKLDQNSTEDASMAEAGEAQGDEEGTAGADPAAAAANDAAIARLRTMIASLKEGASFCKRLTASLQQVQTLLANPAAGVVNDAIVFLTLCKTYDVTGAAKALRGMWPLVFSKHEPVRQAVLDAWHILHLHDRPAKQQLEELLTSVIPDTSLSELTAVEAIFHALVQQGKLLAPVLAKLLVHDVCHYYTKLQEHIQQQKLDAAATAAATQGQAGGDTEMMDAGEAPNGADKQPATEAAAGDGAANGLDKQAQGAPEELAVGRTDFVQQLRRCFTLLSLLTAAQPDALIPAYVPVLLEVGFSPSLGDAWIARYTCLALRYAASQLVPAALPLPAAATHIAAAAAATTAASSSPETLSAEALQAALAAIVRLLVAPPAATMAPNWPSAAEAAVAALYALSPQPEELMVALLEEMFRRCRPTAAVGGSSTQQGQQGQLLYGFSAAALSRFFFVLGRTSLQHLLCIEQLGKAIRASRLAASRAAAEAADRARESKAAAGGAREGRKSGKAAAAAQHDDIAMMLGAGSVTADAELDDLVDMVEAQILAKDQLLGCYGALLSRMVHLRAFTSYPQELQSSALLALTQLMAVDVAYCSDNVAVLFTLLCKGLVSAPMRVNMVVALADLASRFPNVLEPWTHYMYKPLEDPEPSVRLAALSSLTHLVLGGMVKAKGNVAKVAMLLVDDCPELVDRAVLFFESLAASGSGSTRSAGSAAAGASAANPVYNLLPDCLSGLLDKNDPPVRDEQLQVIMTQLLSYVKDKQAESLRERLVARLQVDGPREWRLVAWCIAQLGYSEKGLKRIMEMVACYRHTLAEQQVFDVFMSLADKARKATGGKAAVSGSSGIMGAGDFRAAVEEWVADLMASREAALEAAEVEAMAAAKLHQEQQQQQGHTGQTADAAEQAHQEAGSKSDMADEQQQQTGGDCNMVDVAQSLQVKPSSARAEQQREGDGAEEEQELVLVQPQDAGGADDDDDKLLLEAAAAATATAGLQRLSIAGRSSTSAAVARASRAVRSSAAGADATPAAAAGTAAKATGGRQQRKGSGAAAAVATTAKSSRQLRQKQAQQPPSKKRPANSDDDSSEDESEEEDSSDSADSNDDCSDGGSAPAGCNATGSQIKNIAFVGRSAHSRSASSGRASRLMAGGHGSQDTSEPPVAGAASRRQQQQYLDSSSEDDD